MADKLKVSNLAVSKAGGLVEEVGIREKDL